MLTLKKHSHSWPKRISGFIFKHKYLFLALLISVVVFHQWLSVRLFSYSDGWFWYATNLRDYLTPTVWSSSVTFGGVDPNLWRIPLNMLFGVTGLIGWDYAQANRLIALVPVIILPVWSSYLLINYLFRNERAALIGSLVFAFNTYFLSIATQGQVLLTLAFSLGVFGFYFAVRHYDRSNVKYLLSAILLLFACGFTDFRSLYLVMALLAIYTIFLMIHRRRGVLALLRDFFIITIAETVLNLFWLLPAFIGGAGFGSGVLGRPLFGNQFWTLIDAVTLHHPFWNGANTTWFISTGAPWYFWVAPILTLVAIILWPKNRYVVFFGLVAIIGVFLSKEANPPFGGVYEWAYAHLPGFNAYRESTKFYFYTALAYSVLIASLVHRLSHMSFSGRRRIDYTRITKLGAIVVAGGIVTICFVVTAPFITNKMAAFMQPRAISNDYTVLKQFLENQPDYFRTLWLPTASRWGLNTKAHPAVNAVDVFNMPAQGLETQYASTLRGTDMVSAIESGRLANILDVASVKYVIVPLDDPANSDDFFSYYKTARSDYITQLNQTSRLRRVDIHTGSLAIYENLSYQPHVSVSGAPYIASAGQNLGKEYSFLKTTGVVDPLFVDKSSGIGGAGLVGSLFTAPSLIKSGERTYLQDSFYRSSSGTEMVYKDTAARDINYSTSSNKMTVFSHSLGNPTVNNDTIPFNLGTPTTLAATSFRQGSTYLVLDNTATLVRPNTTVNFGSSKLYKSAGIYEADKNLISNSSFDSGLWQPAVSDCHNYDNHPQITQSIVADNPTSEHHYALQLEATHHIACTTTTFDVTPDTHVFLNFDYRGMGVTRQAGFHILFNDAKKTELDEHIALNDDQWSHALRYVTVPSGATKATIYLYAHESDGVANNIVRYSNVSVSTARATKPIPLDSFSAQFDGVPLKVAVGNNTVRYDTTDYGFHNLIANPSFEHGLWQPKVGDCSNYDSNPKIAQSIDTSDFTTGEHSLQLEATRHTACTFLSFPLDAQSSQLLSFDYQSPNSGQAGYYVSFNDPRQTSVTELLPTKDGGWKHLEKEIKAPAGATMATIYLYAYESDGVTNNIVRYDNVSFMKISSLSRRFYLTTRPTAGFETPASVNFKMINPDKYVIDVNGAKSNFLLHLGENYDQGWKIAIVPERTSQARCRTPLGSTNDKGGVQECDDITVGAQYTGRGLLDTGKAASTVARHIKVNDFSNGWLVDPTALQSQYDTDHYTKASDGGINFRIIAYYQPEASLNTGAIVSGTGLVICIGLLMIPLRGRTVKFY